MRSYPIAIAGFGWIAGASRRGYPPYFFGKVLGFNNIATILSLKSSIHWGYG